MTILEIESEIRDLARWAHLVKRQVYESVGSLECRDRKCVEAPDLEEVNFALLLADRMLDAAKELEAKFDSLTTKPAGGMV